MAEQKYDEVKDIQKKAVFNAPIDKVWQAVSTSEGIAAWFMPNDFRPEVGYEFTIQSPFGPSPCKVVELDPPKRLSFLWDQDGWQVTFELVEKAGQTEFTLTHSGWKPSAEQISKAGEKSSVIRDRMDQGWENIVHEKLRRVVEG